MHGIIARKLAKTVLDRLQNNPAVALLGARQVGKSTLAEILIKPFPKSIYLDLERPRDRNKLTDAEAFFDQFHDHLICLDEIQRAPEIFPILRSAIDRAQKNSQFLILGSASRDLIRQSSESLAGRIAFLEVTPFMQQEVSFVNERQHWLKGGYPRSLLSEDNEVSVLWREDYIATFLERDIPQLGFQIPTTTLHRFWQMLAHSHGQVLNSSKLGASIGVSSHTIKKYLDLLEKTFVVRVLPPYFSNTKKRLVKSPKVYIRDSGILHSLLGIETHEDLFGHPVYGSSYEGYVIENILAHFPRWQASFYRTSNNAEMDLVLKKGSKILAVEIKSSTNPKVTTGFWKAKEVIAPDQTTIIAPIDGEYPIAAEVKVSSLSNFLSSTF